MFSLIPPMSIHRTSVAIGTSSYSVKSVGVSSASNQPELMSALTAAITADLASPDDGLKERRLKIVRYDGLTPWEIYWAEFNIIAAANKWSPAERSVQLASALEGDARRVFRDVTVAELDDPSALVLALKTGFGDTTPAVVMRQKFNSRIRADGEKLGVFGAELCSLPRKNSLTLMKRAIARSNGSDIYSATSVVASPQPRALKLRGKASSPTNQHLLTM